MSKFAIVAAGVAFTAGISAQTTHLVGPSGLPQIRDAVAIAAPGDRIHVEPGVYAQFEANVGVTIRALVPGTVTIQDQAAFVPPGCDFTCAYFAGQTRLSAAAGQELHVVGLSFRSNPTEQSVNSITLLHQVNVTAGRVTFDDCQFSARHTDCLVVDDATCHLQDCTAIGQGTFFGGAGLHAIDADVTAVGCTFTGTTGVFGGPPGPGIQLDDSRLHASSINANGGSGAPTGSEVAVRTSGASTLWLTDSTLTGGPSDCALEGTGLHRLDRCTLVDNGANCTQGSAGYPQLGIERVTPLSPGQTFTLNFRTAPNEFVVVFAGPLLGTLDAFPILEQPSWLDENHSFTTTLMITDATGFATASWSIPNGAGIHDLTLWFKGISSLTFPLQVSPVVGGVAR